MINDGQDLEMEMINIELKHGYKSRSYKRFEQFKRNYYNIFEEILLKRNYMLYEIPHIFYNIFRPWYDCNSKSRDNKTRVDMINWFLKEYEV